MTCRSCGHRLGTNPHCDECKHEGTRDKSPRQPRRRRVAVPFDFTEITTGGNCTALEYRFNANAYALLTVDGEASQPEYNDEAVVVGIYADDDESDQLVSFTVSTFREAVQLVRSVDMVGSECVACSLCHTSGHHVFNCPDRAPVKGRNV